MLMLQSCSYIKCLGWCQVGMEQSKPEVYWSLHVTRRTCHGSLCDVYKTIDPEFRDLTSEVHNVCTAP